MTVIIFVLVVGLHINCFLTILFYPLQAMLNLYLKTRNSLILIFAMPGYCVHRITRGGGERLIDYTISQIPSHHIRKLLYKGLGAKLDKNVVVYHNAEIRAPFMLKIGEGTIIGDHAILDSRSGLTIGKNVNLSSNVSIWTLQHDHRDPLFGYPPSHKRLFTVIEDRVWLGCNVIVLPGVTIGEGAVCCAGSVITKDVEPYSVVAGIPAKKVNERPKNLKYNFDGKSARFY